ncbi:MAG: TenA family protein [Chloroflexi bacterium]|nr:TenA family protein [Chloroflexota bacterium]
MSTLTEELRQRHGDLWERMVTHPFVRELGDGTLPRRKLRHYFLQDRLFVDALVKTVALAIAKAPDSGVARPLGDFLRDVLHAEDDLFRRTFQSLGVDAEEQRAARPSEVTLAFSSYLVCLAYEGTFEETVCALLVTEWTYHDWATRLVAARKLPGDDLYRGWIDIHVAETLGQFVAFLRSHLDRADLGPRGRERVEQVFSTVLQYELEFWEAAYQG